MADPWKTPTLFSVAFPYLFFVFGFSIVFLCPRRMRVIISHGSSFLYSVVQSRVLSTFPNALVRPISIICVFFVDFPRCDSSFTIASDVDKCVLHPYFCLGVRGFRILGSFFVRSCDRILYIICVRHIGRYEEQSPTSPLFLYMRTTTPSTHSGGICMPLLVFRRCHVIYCFLAFLWIFLCLFLCSPG